MGQSLILVLQRMDKVTSFRGHVRDSAESISSLSRSAYSGAYDLAVLYNAESILERSYDQLLNVVNYLIFKL